MALCAGVFQKVDQLGQMWLVQVPDRWLFGIPQLMLWALGFQRQFGQDQPELCSFEGVPPPPPPQQSETPEDTELAVRLVELSELSGGLGAP